MANGDLFIVRMGTTYLGQNCENVFFYQQTNSEGVANSAELLAQAFENLFGLEVGNGVFDHAGFIASWQYVSLAVQNLFSATELFNILNGGTNLGAATGERMPSFVAYRFTHPRERTDMRAGNKYFPGVPEAYGLDGNVAAGVITLMADLTAALGSNIFAEDGLNNRTFAPVIVKRIPVVEDGVTVGYRLPENQEELVRYFANDWTFVESITTMNSRKVGRGV